MPVILSGIVLLGLAVGSFLNVVIYRVPNGLSLSHPPSACPKCGAPIKKRHNVPILGWFFLHGRCAACRAPISIRYPLVELATAVLFGGLTVRFAHLHRYEALPPYLYLAAIGICLAMIDLDVQRLPDSIVLPSYPVLAVLFVGSSWIHHDWPSLLRAAVGGIALYAAYFAIAFAYPAGMGFGDVKLAGLLGASMAYLSWPALAVGSFGAFLLGGTAGAAVILSRRGTRKSALPFGPFMIAATYLAVFAADPIWKAYTRATLGT